MESKDDKPQADVVFDFEHDPAAPRAARAAVHPLVADDEALSVDVGLVTSELVSNVVRHTDDGGTVEAWDRERLRLEVHDSSTELPTLSPDAAVGGRGLGIVARLTSSWGSEPTDTGKTVWAEFERNSAPADPPEPDKSGAPSL